MTSLSDTLRDLRALGTVRPNALHREQLLALLLAASAEAGGLAPNIADLPAAARSLSESASAPSLSRPHRAGMGGGA